MKSILRGALLVPTAVATLFSTTLPLTVNAQQALHVGAARQAAPATQNAKESKANKFGGQGSGTLMAMIGGGKTLGQCPLKHTSVTANISGYVSRVTVKQIFENPFKDKIEAIYTFPLSETGAVDDMKMKVGDRIIKGTIKKREDAKAIYDQAKANGQVASLLDQERTNIFTQSVANILPGNKIEVTIQYVDLLPYEAGRYTFAFPTVVGPRFIPGTTAVGKSGTGRIPDTDMVPDASKITPPVAAAGTRAGHDISIDVNIDSGVPISGINSKVHEVNIAQRGLTAAQISLTDKDTLPNKDFVLSWDVASDAVKSGYLTYKPSTTADGYFTLMVMPPKRVKPDQIQPKEMIFVIDCSGSQSGKPLDKCKETMRYIIEHMNANDTFQIIAFSNEARPLFAKPEKVSAEMKAKALKHINELQANGGTWMAPAVEQACKIPADEHRLRVVTFMTDGYVGNDFEILGMIKKLRDKSRWFSFGTGSSVNRMLIDGMAKEGGGEADYVLLNTSGNEVGKKFYDRISTPVLTDVELAWDGLSVKEVFPNELSDVWAERPLYIKGRYIKPGAGTVTISGYSGGKPYTEKLAVKFPENANGSESIASVWARAKVDRLMSEDYAGAQTGAVNKELKDEIVKVALDHHIMTQYTSFVAVEEKKVTKDGVLKTVVVPVELPDGVDREGALGEADAAQPSRRTRGKARGLMGATNGLIPPPPPSAPGYGGSFGGSGSGYGGRMVKFQSYPNSLAAGAPLSSPAPYPSKVARQMSVHNLRPEPAEEKSRIAEFSAKKESRDDRQSNKQDSLKDKELAKAKPTDALSAKLTPEIQTLLANVKAGKSGEKIAGLEIVNGLVMVSLELSEASEVNLKRLQKLGFKIILLEKNRISGKISVEQLEELAKLQFVKSIHPYKSSNV